MISLTKVWLHHDSARFEELVRAHGASLYRVAYRLCGDQDDAEDLLQEALLEAFEAFGRFRAGTHFDRWVFRIMRNSYIDRVRKRPKARIDSLDGTHGNGQFNGTREIVDLTSVPDLRILADTLDGPIQLALQSLPEEFRTVVILSDLEELSYQEISQTLGCPIGTVRSRLHRGRSILKEKLKSYVRY